MKCFKNPISFNKLIRKWDFFSMFHTLWYCLVNKNLQCRQVQKFGFKVRFLERGDPKSSQTFEDLRRGENVRNVNWHSWKIFKNSLCYYLATFKKKRIWLRKSRERLAITYMAANLIKRVSLMKQLLQEHFLVLFTAQTFQSWRSEAEFD